LRAEGKAGKQPAMVRIMRMLILAAALGGLFALGVPSRLLADPGDIAAAARSVVRVVLISEDGGHLELIGHGSGVAIGPDRILTNAHVVAAAREDETMRIGVVPSEGQNGWFARVVAFSPGNDLALLQLIEPGTLPAATLYTGPVADGADVYAVGYPGNVDLAQGYNIGDIVSPSAPVKTRGSISAGRSSKQFDTLLHTAPVGAGNSGGPLLDACGRVIGINTFGTVSQGSDSEFFFAASTREIARFLLAARVKPRTTGTVCRSLADLDRAEADRLAGEKAHTDEAARAAAALEETTRREVQLEVISQRENGMALAGLALLLALGSGGTAFLLLQKADRRGVWIAGGATVLLLGGAAAAWLSRPALTEIDSRVRDMMQGNGKASARPGRELAGNLVCVLDLDRSRVTVSDTADVDLDWRENGCVGGRSQFALGPEGWFRVVVPRAEDTVTVARFDPTTATYRTDNYFLGADEMNALRAQYRKLQAPACGADEAILRRFGEEQRSLAGALPAPANERLVFVCGQAK